ncbi:hypothetical protein LX64_02508 [Chitinophaga skermanii]|uniref:DUF2262 domain-containing protein n=1 Tax=Chitinophaga skermanii TaxID=331697 RepID=A0A327QM65_9BACT|nr:hypothetical protein [Chitinophaga skermanii]RAJ05351.1 hypothetical protein LX64_02508 [Chitinophaga skermanii]
MGFFNLFKQQQPLVDDPFFGTLRVMTFKQAENNYFEGKILFEPTQQLIKCMIDAEGDLPTAEQRAFYQRIQQDFPGSIEKAFDKIEKEFDEWKPGFKIGNFNDEFQIIYAHIPRTSVRPMEWDLTFHTYHAGGHDVTVLFKDDEPAEIVIDG